MAHAATIETAPPVSAYPLALRDALRHAGEPLARFEVGELTVEVQVTTDSVFAIVRRPGAGWRCVPHTSPCRSTVPRSAPNTARSHACA